MAWTLLFGAACAEEPLADGEHDVFFTAGAADGFGVTEGTTEALGVLRVANETSREDLVAEVDLAPVTADAIATYRAGADGMLGTADDVAIASLMELDAIPYTGPIAFSLLLVRARVLGYVGRSDPGAIDPSAMATTAVVRVRLHPPPPPFDATFAPAVSLASSVALAPSPGR
jgi:hypothetical protein